MPDAPRLIAQQDGHRVWLVNLAQNDPFQSPCPGEEFAALIAVYDSSVTNDNRNAISDALIEQGCRYGVCYGFDCSVWDDALDWAYLATAPCHCPSDERFVMTTWHEDEPLEDVTCYLLNSTIFDSFEPRNFVVLMIGSGPEEDITMAMRFEIANC